MWDTRLLHAYSIAVDAELLFSNTFVNDHLVTKKDSKTQNYILYGDQPTAPTRKNINLFNKQIK